MPAVKQEIGGLKAELRALHSTLNTLKAAPTTASLRETVALLEAEIQDFQVQLEPLRSSAVKPVPEGEKAAISNEHTRLQKVLKGRKNQLKEFWDALCDGCVDVNPSDLWVSDHAVPLLWDRLFLSPLLLFSLNATKNHIRLVCSFFYIKIFFILSDLSILF